VGYGRLCALRRRLQRLQPCRRLRGDPADAFEKGGEDKVNASSACTANDLRRREDVGGVAAEADGAAAASTTGVRGCLVDKRRRSTADRASGPTSRSGEKASPKDALQATVVAAALPAGGKRALTRAASAAAAAAVAVPALSGAVAPEATGPMVATRRSMRRLRAAELAAAGLEVANPSPAITRKRAAAIEAGAASSLPRKLSRRLADRLISTADDSIGPSTTKWSSTELPSEAVPNSTTCTLMSELDVPVDTGRLGKDMHSFFGGRIDRDVVAVTITAALNKNPYPYGSRYPLPGTCKRVVCISSLVGTVIVWPISGLTY